MGGRIIFFRFIAPLALRHLLSSAAPLLLLCSPLLLQLVLLLSMPFFLLCLKADLESVASVAPGENHRWTLDLQEGGGSEKKRGVVVSDEELHDMAGGTGQAHMVFSFAKGGKQCSINVTQLKGVTRPITEEDSGAWVPVVCFDCRGCEPIAYTPGDGFVVTAAGGALFEDVDLSDEWTEYDEKAGCGCSVMGLESRFEVHREKK